MTASNLVEQRILEYRRLVGEGLINREGHFFPSVHYPPITMYPDVEADALLTDYRFPEDGLLDVYLHVPFCISQCQFCHYPVKTNADDTEKQLYISDLLREIDLYRERFAPHPIKARSVLLAGGTPTDLHPRHLEELLQGFEQRVDLSECAQYNVDLDPPTMLGDAGAERLQHLKDHGVDRLTIGIQALDDDILRKLNRPHTVMDALYAIERAKQHGFDVNVEFIFGLPWQSREEWIEQMRDVVRMNVDEIQLYRLKVEPYGDRKGPVERIYERQPQLFPDVDETMRMKATAHEILEEAGFSENLGRVFTRRREDYSRYAHNQCCELLDQVGFGLTAFSSYRDRFTLNTQNFHDYHAAIAEGRLPINRGRVRNHDEQCCWAFILPLKNRSVRKGLFQLRTGCALNDVYGESIELFKEHGLMKEDDTSVSLTRTGRFFADEVCLYFMARAYQPFPEEMYQRGALNPFRQKQVGRVTKMACEG